MKVTVNGVVYDDAGKPPEEKLPPRFRWVDLGRFGRIPEKKISNALQISYTLPGDSTPTQHVYGNSLILVDGMTITVSP